MPKRPRGPEDPAQNPSAPRLREAGGILAEESVLTVKGERRRLVQV